MEAVDSGGVMSTAPGIGDPGRAASGIGNDRVDPQEIRRQIRDAVRMAEAEPGQRYPRNLPDVAAEFMVDREVLRYVRGVLAADLAGHKSFEPGTRQDLIGKASLSVDQIGRYPAAQGLAGTCDNAFLFISAAYEIFLATYEDFIAKIARSIEVHAETEATNEEGIEGLDATVDG